MATSQIGQSLERGMRLAQMGMVVNAALAIAKLLAGILGHSYALVADAIESASDVMSSLIVWGGLRLANRSATEEYPFGYARAEQVAAAVVGIMLVGAGIGISIAAIREIRTPHHAPAPFTLVVLVLVILIKEGLYRYVGRAGGDLGSRAIAADAWHHRSDAITSLAAFIGISIALIKGPGWEQADDWAALVASGILLVNGLTIIRPAVGDLMDRAPSADLIDRVAAIAQAVPDVRLVEKVMIRKAGLGFFVDLHVQASPEMSLQDAHILSGKVKSAIREAEPRVLGALIHMEPYEEIGERR
ncbi:MAG TPA: cation diffusion facilitator family transporter [Gemmatimonadaceae bacterium]|nr:cation diffusion facilitator family transporter [Gemmatimonadaceae bacterium]